MKTSRPSDICLEVSKVSKTFRKVKSLQILSEVDLSLGCGEMIAIVGSSGTGKTTLLHILGGLDRPDSGSVSYFGKDIFRQSNGFLDRFRNRTIGFVFQFHYLLPEFTALENTFMPGLIAGLPKKEITTAARRILERVGLGERTGHKVGELSGGEQQRVAVARALVMEPKILLADEPTGNLDPATGNGVFDLLQELNRDMGLSTVMVTHNLELAARMDRCLTLAKGALVQTDLAATRALRPLRP
ncbi:MAG: ABC transporter ATP-binding protein [Thermodesulfobacteriota bacterium]